MEKELQLVRLEKSKLFGHGWDTVEEKNPVVLLQHVIEVYKSSMCTAADGRDCTGLLERK